MAHIWMSHVPHMEWVMSHIWMSHVPHMNESCPTYEWVMSHTWMSHVTHMNESCPTYEMRHPSSRLEHSFIHATSYTDSSHVTREWVMSHMKNESCLIGKSVTSYLTHSYTPLYTQILAMSHAWMSHVTHTGRDSFTYGTWFILNKGHDSFTYKTWHIYLWDMTHLHM